MGATDPLGLWSPGVHKQIISTAFPGLPANLIEAIQNGSAGVDAIQNQLPGIGKGNEGRIPIKNTPRSSPAI